MSAIFYLLYTSGSYCKKYLKFSGCTDPMNKKPYHGITRLMLLCHSIEKGLTFKFNGGRQNFGVEKMKEINALLVQHQNSLSPKMQAYVEELQQSYALSDERSTKDSLLIDANDHQKFLHSRKSVRNYSLRTVPVELIEKCISYANYSPTVCNRQNIYVENVTDHLKIDKLLVLQGGNSGFTNVQGVLVVYANLQGYLYSKEMHQCFVDGGIRLHSILLNFHAEKIGTCPLAWMPTPKEERKALKIIDLAKNYRIVALASYGGSAPDKSNVFSPRGLR